MSDTPSSTSVPTFKSTLPESLLADKTPLEKYLYESQSRNEAAVDWLVKTIAAQADKMEAVHLETRATNGKVAQAMLDIAELKRGVESLQKDTAPVVKAYGTAKSLARNKVAWAGTIALFGIGIPLYVKYAPDPLKVIAWAFGAAFS